MPAIQVGDHLPNLPFALHDGRIVQLAELHRQGPLVLYFYPKDGTAVCTRQACAFRDAYEQFSAAGATVVGVSSDSLESHQQFARQRELPFLLAADPEGALRRALGVPRTLWLLPGRVTYVIDRQGVVRRIFSAPFAAGRHVEGALEALGAM